MEEGVRRELLLTPGNKAVLSIIQDILKENGQKSLEEQPHRIRKLHKELAKRGEGQARPISKCLISNTIKALVEAKILVPVERKVAPGDAQKGVPARSILYDWNQMAFNAFDIKIVRARPPKNRKQGKAKKPGAPPVAEDAPAHEDWHLALKQEIKDKEKEYAALGIDIAQLKELDASAENVRMCFLQRRRR